MSGIQIIYLITGLDHFKTGQKSVLKVKCSDFGCSSVQMVCVFSVNLVCKEELSFAKSIGLLVKGRWWALS